MSYTSTFTEQETRWTEDARSDTDGALYLVKLANSETVCRYGGWYDEATSNLALGLKGPCQNCGNRYEQSSNRLIDMQYKLGYVIQTRSSTFPVGARQMMKKCLWLKETGVSFDAKLPFVRE